MDDCIFCKIVKKEIPSDKVYEDNDFIAFLDIQPVSTGHMLIIPKKHVVWMQEAEDELLAGIFKLAKKLMTATIKGINCDYVQVSVVGKDVPHLHIHLIPRYLDDNLPQFSTIEYSKTEAQKTIKKITNAL